MPELTVVGRPVVRKDLFRKATGSGQYTVDLELPRQLHGKVLRSPFAHARILHLDPGPALKLPGVLAVVTGIDFPVGYWGSHIKDQPPMARGVARYIGEPVAAVAAVDEEVAEEACQRIQVEYEPLPAVYTIEEALAAEAPLLHPDLLRYERNPQVCRPQANSNVLNHTRIRRGEVEAALRRAVLVEEGEYRTQAQEHVSLEPSACLARWERDGHLTVWSSTQCPFIVREDVARSLGVLTHRVRVIVPDVGGGFGGKVHVRLEPIAALLSQRAGRPVKMVHTRYEEFIASTVRHPSWIRLRAGLDAEGRLSGWQAEIYFDTGAYSDSGEMVSWQTALGGAGPYRVGDVAIDTYAVYTNKVPAGAFRGMGWPQVMWAVESHLDRLARRAGIDPVELRLKNALRDGDETVTGERLEGVGLVECLQTAAEAIGWGKPRPAGHGRAVVSVMKSSAPNSTASAVVKVNEDGAVQVVTGAAEIGTGSHSALAQICAEALGVSYEAVEVTAPDTAYAPFDRGAVSDRTTFHLGDAVYQAALMARRQLLEVAAARLEAAVEDLELEDGILSVRGVPERRLSFREAARLSYVRHGGPILGQGRHLEEEIVPLHPETGQSPRACSHYKFGAQAVEVAVDPETGMVQVEQVVSGHDCGQAVNPLQVEGQIQGAVAQGLGYALMEEMRFEAGQVTNPTLMDYPVPTAPDVPPIRAIAVEVPHPHSPFGVKGVGEPGIIGVAPAIGNAVHDALGICLSELPLTPERILRALEQAGDSRPGSRTEIPAPWDPE
ncbi:MAG: xanthine dehydrogenase family protein molybdopterin-binding subunit [Firmicutes bacterium]|nr:xanthine dehydrogenase family protein molybdopterin-binding subunit [Bacillota bacterium]